MNKLAKDITNLQKDRSALDVMDKIKYEEIVENVVKHRCPGVFYCTVATTCYEEDERKARCLRCWLNTVKERNIEVLYGEEE